MILSKQTSEFLSSLDTFSGHKLTCSHDLGMLMDLASLRNRANILDELSFHAKFISKTHDIMKHIGQEGNGYDNIAREFTEAVEHSSSLIRALLTDAAVEDRQRFTSNYLAPTHESLRHLLALCYDLSWYKNWIIDHPNQRIG